VEKDEGLGRQHSSCCARTACASSVN
jgi:hypothetical protein